MIKMKSLLNLSQMQNLPIDEIIHQLLKDTKAVFDFSDLSQNFAYLYRVMCGQIENFIQEGHLNKNDKIITSWVGGIIYALVLEEVRKYRDENVLYPEPSYNTLYKQYCEELQCKEITNTNNSYFPEITKPVDIEFMNWLGCKALSDQISFIADFLKITVAPKEVKNSSIITSKPDSRSLKNDKMITATTSATTPNFFPKYVAAYSFLNILLHLSIDQSDYLNSKVIRSASF